MEEQKAFYCPYHQEIISCPQSSGMFSIDHRTPGDFLLSIGGLEVFDCPRETLEIFYCS